MSEKQRTAFSTWQQFLPPRAIVMSRRQDHSIHTPIFGTAPNQEQTMTDSLEKVTAELQGCQRCKLCSARKSIVVGEGNACAELVFVGEGPGEQEDIQGRPFVGKAGQLLDKMIEAIGLSRDRVYIMNVVKCRPPGNRNPEPDEITACSPFLYRQLDIIRPKIVVALGKFAVQTLLQTQEGITKIRGTFYDYRGAKLMPTFHPAYLLRNPDSKKEAWADLQLVAKEMGLQLPSKRKDIIIGG